VEEARVNLREKVGQLFVVAARGGERLDEVERHVRDNHVGGVIWFQSTTGETAAANARLQSLARTPLLVSADLEAGMGMRFTDGTWWPPAMAIAATGDPSFAREQGRATARAALAIGVNHILAPVADVNVDPRNPVINTRSFGEDPHEVARHVAALVEGVQEAGALATAKHFPGHGDTHVDSHRALPVLDVTRERLDAVELVPFRAAIAAGVASVMVGHLSVPSLDATPAPVRSEFENVYGTGVGEVTLGGTMPATLSKPVIVGLLRRELGFGGLVITDSMDMGGLAAHFDAAEAAIRAIEAGEDQILYSTDTDAAIRAVIAAVENGRLKESRIDESVERILAAKRRIGSPSAPANDAALAQAAAERSIALVRDRNALLPLRGRIAVSVFAEDPLDDALRGLAGDADPEEADAVVILLGIRPRSGAGHLDVPDEAKRLAARDPERTVAVSFGSPYVIRDLPGISTFVCAWGVQPLLQRAAVRALRGEIPMPGRVPVTLD
jgi:beta-N-acetylhexosaminidase